MLIRFHVGGNTHTHFRFTLQFHFATHYDWQIMLLELIDSLQLNVIFFSKAKINLIIDISNPEGSNTELKI